MHVHFVQMFGRKTNNTSLPTSLFSFDLVARGTMKEIVQGLTFQRVTEIVEHEKLRLI